MIQNSFFLEKKFKPIRSSVVRFLIVFAYKAKISLEFGLKFCFVFKESGSSSDGSEERKIMLGGSSTGVGPWHHDYSTGMSSAIDGIDEVNG